MLFAIKIGLTIIGALFFLYFFWKKLKDDYSQWQVFTAGFHSLVGLTLGYVISRTYLVGYDFWGGLIGSACGIVIAIKRFKMRFFETLEGWVIASLNVLLIFEFYNLRVYFSWVKVINTIAELTLIFLFFHINRRYKRYVWYKSGKVGFSGLLVLGLYFIFRASNLVFSGIMNKFIVFEIVMSVVIAFSSFLALYNLSRKES